jgi:hypothetical protein
MADYYTKHPNAKLNYGWNLTNWLEGTTIAAAAWTVPDGLVKLGEQFTTTIVSITLGGGQLKHTYLVECLITTSTGLEDVRSFQLTIDRRGKEN